MEAQTLSNEADVAAGSNSSASSSTTLKATQVNSSAPNKTTSSEPRISMFFYGTLMDPIFTQSLLSLTSTPAFKPATITGFVTKMWGPYPILVRKDGGKVKGVVWEGATEGDFKRLEYYEGDTYTWSECKAKLIDAKSERELGVVKIVRVFVASDEDDDELEEGDFDLEEFKKMFR